MTSTWHITRDGDTLRLSRRTPARMDFWAETVLPQGRRPGGARGRLAHLVRQDLWRALRRVRGFAPVVEVIRDGESLRVRAGGQVAHPLAQHRDVAQAVLDDPSNRERWGRR